MQGFGRDVQLRLLLTQPYLIGHSLTLTAAILGSNEKLEYYLTNHRILQLTIICKGAREILGY